MIHRKHIIRYYKHLIDSLIVEVKVVIIQITKINI